MSRLLPLLLALLCAVAPTALASGSGKAVEGSINPHNQPDACVTCHEPGPDPKTPGKPRPSLPTCLHCHPEADMHPVSIAPDQVKVPKDWPLEDGLVTCATCHAEPSCEKGRDPEPPYHRGGNVQPITDFCYRCHERANYTRGDPHHAQEIRNNRDGTCSVCHSGVPRKGAAPSQSRLRHAAEKVCHECHRPPVHTFVSGHLGEKVDADVAARLPATMALDEGNRITCFTCHEVHGDLTTTAPNPPGKFAKALREHNKARDWKETMPEYLDWPAEGDDPAHPPLLAASLDDGALCGACHGDGP